MISRPFPFCLGLLFPVLACAATAPSPAAPKAAAVSASATPAPALPLWPAGTPGALGQRPEDVPTITVFAPPAGTANGASMVIFQGGSYGSLTEREGAPYAAWLNAQGIICYVVKYRLGSSGYRHPAMLNDAARALRLARAFARRDSLDPARVGAIGSSAGGHLVATLVTHFDAGRPDAADPVERESSRPDLAILCYPVITLGEFSHGGSRKNLLGASPDPALLRELSNEFHVTAQTPPCFLWHTADDKPVPVENSLLFAAALRRAGVPFSLHVYEKGEHGLGLGRPGKPAPPWAEQCLYWLRERRFLP